MDRDDAIAEEHDKAYANARSPIDVINADKKEDFQHAEPRSHYRRHLSDVERGNVRDQEHNAT